MGYCLVLVDNTMRRKTQKSAEEGAPGWIDSHCTRKAELQADPLRPITFSWWSCTRGFLCSLSHSFWRHCEALFCLGSMLRLTVLADQLSFL
ncbi:hypothetical protein MHYP_G00280690 [Metynnis hypsauchen]